MTQDNWISVLALVVPIAIAGCGAVVGLAIKLGLHAQRLDEHGKRLEAQDARLNNHGVQINDIKPILAALVEGVEWIKQALDRRERPPR
jgi:hypothetical protein